MIINLFIYLRNQGVEAVNFLPFLNKGVEFGDAFESEFIHEIDLVGSLQVSLLRGRETDDDDDDVQCM